MTDKVCLPYFHFLLLIVVTIALAFWGMFNLSQYSQCQKDSKSGSGLLSSLSGLFSAPMSPVMDPDVSDDLAVGDLPPTRRDYRKMSDPLKAASRRYTDYPTGGPTNGPWNVQTQGYFPSYQMMGYLNNPGDADRMLKLFGRRIDRYRWEYYTTHHDDPQLKIPIKIRGDKELMSGDDVNVNGFNGKYNVTLYDYEAPKYIPYVH